MCEAVGGANRNKAESVRLVASPYIKKETFMLSSRHRSPRGVLAGRPRLGLLLLLVAVISLSSFSGQVVEADAASTSFSPTQVSLPAINDSTTITVETVVLDDVATGVQINVQHSADLEVSTPACVGIFSEAPLVIGPSPVDGGTLIGCAFLIGTVSDTAGDVMTFTLSRIGDFDEEIVTFLVGGAGGTGFSNLGVPIGAGSTNQLTVLGDKGITLFGECNGDQIVSAADITAVIIEIFDGDGDDPAAAAGGDFSGTPGCDANEDGTINAADITCVVFIIFDGPGACAVP